MEPQNKNSNTHVETYAEDMADFIVDNKEAGLIKKIIHEEEEKQERMPSPEAKKSKLFLSTSVLIIFLAVGILAFFVIFGNKIHTVPVAEEAAPIIFLDSSSFPDIFGLEKERIAQTVLNKVNETAVKKGGIEGIYLVIDKQIVGLREFLSQAGASFLPASENFIDNNFLIGVSNGESKDLFILLRARSFPDIFPAMRVWEPKMFLDLRGFFGKNISPDTSYLLIKDFEDTIVQNKNARVLFDNDGGVAIMYVFVDDNSVVIADSEEAVRAVRERLVAGEIKR